MILEKIKNNHIFKKIESYFDKIEKFSKKKFFDRGVVGGIILMGLVWLAITYFQYQGFAYRTGDTAVAEQAIWNTVHGRIFYQSFLETSTNLKEHLNFVQLLYVPLYAIFPHTLTLFFIIQLGFVLGAIYLYKFVKKRISPVAGVVAVLIFILNPLTISQVTGDMHVVSVAGPIFLMLLMSYHERKYQTFLFWVVFMVLISEFVAPTIFLVGALAFFERRSWKWFFPPMLGGVGLYLAAKYYITIGFGSNANIMSKFTPQALQSIYKIEKRIDLLKESLASLLWVFPFFSKYSILLIPSILIALFIILPGRIGIGNHIFILIPPILTIIFIDLLEKFKNYRKIIVVIGMLGIVLSFYPSYKLMEIDRSDLANEMHKAVKMVKDGGSLTASTQFGPILCRREEFFLPLNNKMTDYIVLKTSKIIKEKEGNGSELKYDEQIRASGLYKAVFEEGRVIVFVKKEKIAELMNTSVDKIDKMSDEDIKNGWKYIERNVGWLK